MGPRAGLDRCGKSRPPPGFDPRTVQPVASRYTDYVTRPTRSGEDSGKKRTIFFSTEQKLLNLRTPGAIQRIISVVCGNKTV